jgi:hypothetical protein
MNIYQQISGRIKYLIAFVMMSAGLTLAFSYPDILYMVFGFHPLFDRGWVYLDVHALAKIIIALGLWQLNTSLRWYEVMSIACIWFVGLLPGLYIPMPLWIPRGFGPMSFIEPFEWNSIYVSVGLSVALFTNGILLRNGHRSIRLKHILYLALGGFIMQLIRRSIATYLMPSPYAPSNIASPQQIAITLIIVDAVNALVVSAWLIRILAAVGWDVRDVKGKLLEPFISGWKRMRHPNPLVKQLMVNPQSRIARLAGYLLLIEILGLCILVGLSADFLGIYLFRILTVAILVLPPTISTIIGMSEARGFIQADEMLDEVPIQTYSVETFIAVLWASLYNARWFLLACSAFLLALTPGLMRFDDFPSSFQTLVSLVLIVVTWAGMMVIGTAAGVYSVLRGQSALHKLLVLLLISAAAFILLTSAVGELGFRWRVGTRLANLISYSTLLYMVLVEFIEFGSLSASDAAA